jgi:hypothetical protein
MGPKASTKRRPRGRKDDFWLAAASRRDLSYPLRYTQRDTAAFSPPRTRFARARLPLGPLLASLKSVAAVWRFPSGDQRLNGPIGITVSLGSNGRWCLVAPGIDLYRAGASLELTVGGAARKSTGGSPRPRRLRPSWDGEFLSAPSPIGGQVGKVGPIFSVHR